RRTRTPPRAGSCAPPRPRGTRPSPWRAAPRRPRARRACRRRARPRARATPRARASTGLLAHHRHRRRREPLERTPRSRVLRVRQLRILREHRPRRVARTLEQRRVATEVAEAEPRQPRLLAPEQLARAADLEVFLRDAEAIARLAQHAQPRDRVLAAR